MELMPNNRKPQAGLNHVLIWYLLSLPLSHLLQLNGLLHLLHLTLFQTEKESHTIMLELQEMAIAPGLMIHTQLQVEENTLLSLNQLHLAMFPIVNQAHHTQLHQEVTLPTELRH
jgi:hypothetical protein